MRDVITAGRPARVGGFLLLLLGTPMLWVGGLAFVEPTAGPFSLGLLGEAYPITRSVALLSLPLSVASIVAALQALWDRPTMLGPVVAAVWLGAGGLALATGAAPGLLLFGLFVLASFLWGAFTTLPSAPFRP